MAYQIDKEWLLKNRDKEDNFCIAAGSFDDSILTNKKSKRKAPSKPKKTKNKVTVADVLKAADKLSPEDYANFCTYVELIAGPGKRMSPKEAHKEVEKRHKKLGSRKQKPLPSAYGFYQAIF